MAMRWQRQRLEWCTCWPRNAKIYWQIPGGRGGQEWFSPARFQGNVANTCIWACWSPELRDSKLLLFSSALFVVLCYSSPTNLVQRVMAKFRQFPMDRSRAIREEKWWRLILDFCPSGLLDRARTAQQKAVGSQQPDASGLRKEFWVVPHRGPALRTAQEGFLWWGSSKSPRMLLKGKGLLWTPTEPITKELSCRFP